MLYMPGSAIGIEFRNSDLYLHIGLMYYLYYAVKNIL